MILNVILIVVVHTVTTVLYRINFNESEVPYDIMKLINELMGVFIFELLQPACELQDNICHSTTHTVDVLIPSLPFCTTASFGHNWSPDTKQNSSIFIFVFFFFEGSILLRLIITIL
jgi:branched-subunit amino acid transport protein AzlD